MRFSLDPVIANRIDGEVDDLCRAFSGEFERRQIAALMDDSVTQLVDSAVVLDFLPSLAYRLTRERLNAIRRSTGEVATGSWDVVFVSLSGGGRGQIAAALTTLLSGGQVAVHSAGTAIRGEIDPGVQAVIGELGVDPNDAFAHPMTDEVLAAPDVIVTMGHSVGVVDIPAHVRHQDWRVGDPVGAPLQEIRHVRSDIERRVAALLDELGVTIVGRETDIPLTRRS